MPRCLRRGSYYWGSKGACSIPLVKGGVNAPPTKASSRSERVYFFQDGLRWNIPFGIWLGQQHYIAWLLSWVAILFESTFFLVLLFPRLAWIYVPLGIAFHIGIYLTMKAPFFLYCALRRLCPVGFVFPYSLALSTNS